MGNRFFSKQFRKKLTSYKKWTPHQSSLSSLNYLLAVAAVQRRRRFSGGGPAAAVQRRRFSGGGPAAAVQRRRRSAGGDLQRRSSGGGQYALAAAVNMLKRRRSLCSCGGGQYAQATAVNMITICHNLSHHTF